MASKMLWLDRYFIVIILLFIGVVSQLSATSLFLQHAKTGDRDFFVNVEERFQVEMVIDPQGQQVTAFEIYLSFSDQYLELIDADPINPGIQPVKQGKDLPNGWQIFDNDTHGDPGNKLSNFQIDFSRGLIFGAADLAIKKKSVIGEISFRAKVPTDATTIKVDNMKGENRLTVVRVGNSPTTPFTESFSSNISIAQGLLEFLDSFPKNVTFPSNQVYNKLWLSDYVVSHHSVESQPKWSISKSSNISVEIDPESLIASLSAVDDWFGTETLEFTVTDPQENSSSKLLEVKITAPPVFNLPEKPFITDVNQIRFIDLTEYLKDADDPKLDNVNLIMKENPYGENTVKLNGKQLTVLDDKPSQESIVIVASDADGNETAAEIQIGFSALDSGPIISIITFPPEITVYFDRPEANVPILDLDGMVFDSNYTDKQLNWSTEGNTNVKVEIDPATRQAKIMRNPNWQGSEEVTFIATNPVDLSDKKMMEVSFRTSTGAPIFGEIPPVTILFQKEQPLDLRSFVSDFESNPDQMSWDINPGKFVKTEISNKGLAVFLGSKVGSEEIEVRVIDPDGKQAKSKVAVTVIAPTPPQISNKFPSKITIPRNEPTVVFDLDEFLTGGIDSSDVTWKVDGYDLDKIFVSIDDEQNVTMRSLGAWNTGIQTVTFTAENQVEIPVSVKTRVFTNFPPTISPIDDLTIAGGGSIEVDLNKNIKDLDTKPDQISWTATDFSPLLVDIDSETKIATISASQELSGKEYKMVFIATDPNELTDNQTVNVRVVKSFKTPPVVNSLPNVEFKQGDENQSITLTKYVEDLDTPKKDLKWDYEPKDSKIKVEIDKTTKNVTFSSDLEFVGNQKFTFTVTDPDEQSDSLDMTAVVIERSKEKGPPTVKGIPDIKMKKGTTELIRLNDYVMDPDTLKVDLRWDYAPKDGNVEVKIDSETSNVTLSPVADFLGEEQVTFTASDPENQSSSQGIKVSVLEELEVDSGIEGEGGEENVKAEPPVIRDFPPIEIKQGDVDQSIVLIDYVEDPDTPKKDLKWDYEPKDGNVLVQIDTSIFKVTLSPKLGFTGDQKITFTVTDPGDLSSSKVLSVKVIEPSAEKGPPVVKGIPDMEMEQGDVGQQIQLTNYVKDPDTPKEKLVWDYSPKDGNIEVKIDEATLQATLIPKPGFVGTQEIEFIVTDSDKLSGTQKIKITIGKKSGEGENKSLMITEIPNVKFEQGTDDRSIVLGEHVENSEVPKEKLVWDYSPKDGNIEVEIDKASLKVTLRAKPDFFGTQDIEFKVSDPKGQTASKKVAVTVEKKEETRSPILTKFPLIKIDEGTAYEIGNLDEFVADADTPKEDLKWESKGTKNLTVNINQETRVMEISPKEKFTGTESIDIIVTDPEQNQAKGVIIIDVQSTETEVKAASPVISFPEIKLEVGRNVKLKLDKYVKDKDTPNEDLTWSIKENNTFEIAIEERTLKIKLSEEKKSFRGSQILVLTVVDPEENKDVGIISIKVVDAPDRTPPGFRFFMIPNPIQPDFLTIVIVANEKLKEPPKFQINGEDVPISEVGDNQWKGQHILSSGGALKIAIEGMDVAGNKGRRNKTVQLNSTLSSPQIPVPNQNALHPNYPNPFNPETWIPFQLAQDTVVKLEIFSFDGKLLRTLDLGQLSAGLYLSQDRAAYWDGRNGNGEDVASGVYFGVLSVGDNQTYVQRFVMSK